MTDTPDLRTLAAFAANDVLVETPEEVADAVLAAVLPAHRRQVLAEAADALAPGLDDFERELLADPQALAAFARARIRRLASAAPETAPRPRQDDETAPAVPHDTNGWPYG